MPTDANFDSLFNPLESRDDDKLWELLSLYVDGEADPAQADLVESMLSSDPAYARDFAFLMQTSRAAHNAEEVAPPPGLRDAIFASTVLRPTLLGRLRAAWSGLMTPSAGRYVTVGGTFAAAALLAVAVWPALHPATSVVAHPNNPANLVVANVHLPTAAATHTDVTPTGSNQVVRHNEAKQTLKPDPRFLLVQSDSLGVRPELKTADSRKLTPMHAPSMVTKRAPVNHYLPKVNLPGPDGSQVVTGYSYNKLMDEAAIHRLTPTVAAVAGTDFGPMLAANEDTGSAPPHSVTAPTASVGGAEDATAALPEPSPIPKRSIHVAVLPPDARQNLAAAVIRQSSAAKYSGYDRTVAENTQQREIKIDVFKGSF